jgi:hypothetical protein
VRDDAREGALGYAVVHVGAALVIGVVVGGIVFFLVGILFSLMASGPAAIDSTPEGLAGSLLFAIVIVGLFGGMPGLVIGLVMLNFRVRSPGAFIAAGIGASLIAPILVMALTPLGRDGWAMLVLAVPSGAAAGVAAWWYLSRHTTLLARPAP